MSNETAPPQGMARARSGRIDFRAMADQSTVGIWAIDLEGRTLYANPKTGEMLGVSPDEMHGRPFTEFMDPQEVPLAEFYYARRQRGISETHEFKFRRSDGSPVWVLVQSSPVIEHDETTAWVARLMDISGPVMDRYHARQLNETLRRIIALSSHPIATVDADGRIRDANRAFCLLTDRSKEALSNRPIREICAAWEASPATESGSAGAQNHRVTIDVGGEQRHLDVASLPMPDEDGIDGSLLLFTDVTQLTAATAQAVAARAEMAAIVRENTRAIEVQAAAMELTVEPMAVLQKDRYLWMNKAYSQLFALDAANMVGQRWQDHHSEPARQYLESVARPAIESVGHWRGEVTGQRPNGQTFEAEFSLSRTEAGVVVACVRDISERKRQQARLLDTLRSLDTANDQLREASRLKDLFLACMSHELRTPLHSILGTAEVVLDGCAGALSPGLTGYLAQIQVSGEHLLTLINDILDVSKIGAGQLTLHLTDVSAEYLFGLALDMVAHRVDSKGLRVVRRMPDQPLPLRADQVRVVQILVNLLSNAVKFTPTDGHVEVSLHETDAGVQFVVADTGIGFEQASAHLLFQPFRQLDGSLTRRHGGTGLGLYLARQLAELHGGTLTATGVPGQGAEFVLTLPRNGPVRAAGGEREDAA